MNIVVNTQLLVKDKLDGIGWFTYETLKRITRANPQHKFYFVFDRPYHKEFIFSDNVIPIILYPQSRHPFLWFLRFEILMPFLLKKYKADLYLSPDGWMTLNSSVPCVQVIHDLNFIHYPKDIPYFTRKYYNILIPRYAHKADRIVTVSNYSKQDIVKSFNISPSKIDVAYNGCNTIYKEVSEDEKVLSRKKYSGGNPYFVYVGAIIPRKNIDRLFLAFDSFKKHDNKNTKLLVIGPKKWYTKQIRDAYESMQYKEDVIFLGRLNAAELNKIYAASLALMFVSCFEGFGIPILEAFNSGTAVITSNCTSMPEVAGESALLADPYSVNDITDAMIKISNDPDLRNALIEKARKQSRLYSWDNTANVLWRTIEKVLEKGK